MPYPNIAYKSYCWSFGTTSFRTKNFSQKIETLLLLLDDFWKHPENVNQDWKGNQHLQSSFYDFMKEHKFLTGDAERKAKDAREKTSGLADIGLITQNRKLSKVGKKLLEISKNNDFTADNILSIPQDSYIYFMQMLKTYNEFEGEYVRPYFVLLFLLSKFEYLTYEEFTFLLPLCINQFSTEKIAEGIIQIRNNQKTIDDLIIEILFSMDNYLEAQTLFLNTPVNKELICVVGINRKSRTYDKAYYPFYLELKKVFLLGKEDIFPLYKATKDITIGKYWRSFLFSSQSERAIKSSGRELLNDTVFTSVQNETELKKLFFRFMHLFKAKATLADYFDLNRRYIKNTDIVLFEDSTVKLDIIPKHIFKNLESDLLRYAFTKTNTLHDNIPLNNIFPELSFNEQDFISAVNEELHIDAETVSEAQSAVEQYRYKKFNKMIDEKFSNENLIQLLEYFENREDEKINEYVTDNADIPTIFEYILGIIWYKVCERQGKILDYMKLSLEADLLPKTHAGGGEADIVYEYQETPHYPSHSLLLEATLANANSQRAMELEPVTRHLGQHILRNNNLKSYSVFVSNKLYINVISDFRLRKFYTWYDNSDNSHFVQGLKIIPLETSDLKTIIQNELTYKELYPHFERSYQSSNMEARSWYEDLKAF
ncbi:AlwI family type II restriction endonuclease [Taurinivorans muris]|uniref:AlwI family type II restriction endonuclease n=1 Tax=Taurinivorans muris TaxID=2787751 RepID=A0ABY5Y1R9_9BACT|nr:AlwI family type II restriction endonuclease [Desulfovibrionaceae bacterium LT0009]